MNRLLLSIVVVIGFGNSVIAGESTRIVLAIGQNEGLEGEIPLRYAHEDARAYVRLLQGQGGVAPRHTIVLTEATPSTLTNSLGDIAKLAAKAQGDVLFFFYYSGHGDSHSLHLGKSRFKLSELNKIFSEIPAKLRVSVIDACRSRDDTQTKGFRTAAPFETRIQAPQGLEGVVTIRSSADGEASQESGQLGGAVFTHFFMAALRGAADRDSDQRISLSEAYGYAYDQTVRRSAAGTGNVMHPSVELDIEGAGRLMMTDVLRTNATIQLPKEAHARYLIYRRPLGTLSNETWSDSTRRISVPVTAGEYLVQRRKRGSSGAMVANVKAGKVVRLDSGAFRSVPDDVLAMKGGRLKLVEGALSAGYIPNLNVDGSIAHRGQIRYSLGPVGWALGLSLELGRHHYTKTQDVRTERWFGGDVRGVLRNAVGPVDFLMGAQWRTIFQTVERKTDPLAQAAGYTADSSYTGFGAGPIAGVLWRSPLGPAGFLGLEGTTGLLIVKEGNRLAYRPSGGAGLILGWTH